MLPESKVSAIIGRLKGETSTTIQTYRFPVKEFTEDKAKKWLSDKGVTDYFFEPAKVESMADIKIVNKTHEAILQTLDREVGGCFLSKESFENVDAWAGKQIIYGTTHPDQDAFNEDYEKELKRLDEKVVGKINKAWIELTGHPRLMGELEIMDKNLEKMIVDGKLSHSTAFACAMMDNRLIGEVIPNHLLVFEETEKDRPKDQMAVMLNKEDGDMDEPDTNLEGMFEKIMNKLDVLKTKIVHTEPDPEGKGDGKMSEELTEQLDEATKGLDEFKAKVEELTVANEAFAKDIENLRTIIGDKDTILAEYEQTKKDGEWSLLKDMIPAGVIHDKEEEMRKEFEGNPGAFAMKVLSYKRDGATDKEGEEHEHIDSEHEFTVGVYDSSTRTWT